MPEYTAKMAHAAVERGAAWLDKKCPTWFQEIDLKNLNLKHTAVCVLGQTATCITGHDQTNYFTVLRMISADTEKQDSWAERHGFKAPHAFTDGLYVRYEMLTIAWKEYIRARLESAS